MAAFDGPTIDDLEGDVIDGLRAQIESVTRMYDGTTDSAVYTGAYKFNSTDKQWEKYNGTTWDPVKVGNLADDAVTTASILADAVTTAKFRGVNAAWLRWRNAAGSADISVLTVDNNDNTFLNAVTGKAAILAVNGATIFGADASKLYPGGSSDSKDIGSSSLRVNRGYFKFLDYVTQLSSTGSVLAIKTTTGHDIEFHTSNARRLYIDSGGTLLPDTDSNYAIGTTTKQFGGMFSSYFTAKNGEIPLFTGPSGEAAEFGADGTAMWRIGTSGVLHPLSPSDIGTSSIPVATLYLANAKSILGSDIGIIPAPGQSLGLGADNGLKWTVTLAGAMSPLSNGAYDLGLTGTRIADAFVEQINLGASGGSAFISATATRLQLGTPTAGSAGALVGYVEVDIGGTTRKIPYYAA